MVNTFTILLVDDEISILNALIRLLRPQGYRLLTTDNGADALIMMTQSPVDLVICDMRMPKMDGVTFLFEVKKLGLILFVYYLPAKQICCK